MKRFYVVLLPLLLAACGSLPMFGPTPTPTPEPCEIQAAAYIPALENYFDDWDDAFTIANGTPRSQLSQAIADLQAIKRGVDDLEHPPCTEKVHQLFIDYMDKTIAGFLSFLSQDSDFVVNTLFEDASELLDSFITELAKLKAGYATPTSTP